MKDEFILTIAHMGRRDEKYINDELQKQNKKSSFSLSKIVFLLALVFACVMPFTTVGKKVLRKVGTFLGGETKIEVQKEIVREEVFVEVPVEVAIPTIGDFKPQEKVVYENLEKVVGSETSVKKLAGNSDITLKASVDILQSEKLASSDRMDSGSYEITYEVKVKIPKAAQSLKELEKVNGSLGSIFPQLGELITSAVVSPYYNEIYKNKADRVRRDAVEFNSLLTRHNFFDLQTILNLTSPSGRKVMIMQADMDVVSDGSDGDRLAKMPAEIVNSTFYQPSTSYFWKKQTDTPNPMIAGFEERVKKATVELSLASTTTARKDWLKARLKLLKTKIEDMKWHSYLIAEYDPFIVIPISMLTDMSDSFAPKVGDYAVVIHGETLYPCIVGDGGPTFKVGEASLRMAMQLNKRASIYSRPVSDLSVTYMVFPFSRDSVKSPPDYAKWKEKCEELIDEIGGLSANHSLYEWENTLP